MRLINNLSIIVWYFKNPKFLPNLIFIIKNKIKEIFSNDDIGLIKKKIAYCNHEKFYKINSIKKKALRKKQFTQRSLMKTKKLLKTMAEKQI